MKIAKNVVKTRIKSLASIESHKPFFRWRRTDIDDLIQHAIIVCAMVTELELIS